MSDEAKRTQIVSTFYGRSYANVNLGIFLIFFGVVGAVPLYGLFVNIVLKQADIEWRLGIALGLFCAIAGWLLIKNSRRCFKVYSNPNGSGTISTQEGLFNRAMRYDFAPGGKIKLSPANSESGDPNQKMIHITLIDGNRHFLLDSRNFRKIQESRIIAEFLAKKSGLNLFLPTFDNIEMEPADLQLSISERIKKFPMLLGPTPERPTPCPFTITPLNNGKDRRYSWGFRGNGLIGQAASYFVAVLIAFFLPFFEENQQLISAYTWTINNKNYELLYALGALMVFLCLFLSCVGTTVNIEGYRINVAYTFLGVTYKKRSLLIDSIEEITTKESTSACYVLLLSGQYIVRLRVANSILANYLTSDMRSFLISNR